MTKLTDPEKRLQLAKQGKYLRQGGYVSFHRASDRLAAAFDASFGRSATRLANSNDASDGNYRRWSDDDDAA